MRKLLVILGIPIDDLTMAQALERIEAFIHVGRATGKSHQIATVNADFVVKAMDDPELRFILQEVDMATPDGMPLVWGARLLGVDLAGRVTGADMVPALAERAAQKGYTLYFLGAAPGVAARAADILRERYPGLQIVGVVSPPYGSILEMDPAIAEGIRAARPDILLVAFGNPKQEKWISMYSRELPVPVMIGVGGTLDFIAGITRRAPDWMQRSGLEWLFRLVQEPKRLWRRYVVDMFGFGIFFVRQWWAMSRGRAPAAVVPTSDVVVIENTAILSVRGRLDRPAQAQFAAQADEALTVSPYVIVNLARAEFLDSTAIGTLIGLAKRAREAGGELWLAAVPQQIDKVLSLLRLDRFFETRPDVVAALVERRGGKVASAGAAAPLTASGPQAAAGVSDHAPSGEADGWKVITMSRRVDATAAPAMLEQGEAALAASPRLILDFSSTVFLASAGMAVMVKLNRLAREAGGEVRAVACSADVARTLKLARLDAVIALYDNVGAATKAAVEARPELVKAAPARRPS